LIGKKHRGILERTKKHLKEPPVKKYIVELTAEQREELSHMISTGKASARELSHARILLKADQGPYGPAWSDTRIKEALEISLGTVERVPRQECKRRSCRCRPNACDAVVWMECKRHT
jgi:hypothetical protein